MHAEFEAIDRYLSLSRSLSEEEKNQEMIIVDQKVPQKNFMNIENDVMFTDFSSDEKFNYKVSDILAMGEFAPLDPIPNVGCIQVSESHDQQVQGSESPKSFVDLDNVHDVSLYDENLIIKCEKENYSDCSLVDNFNQQNQEAVVFVKQEMESDDFGYTIIQDQKKEIDHVCSILRINTDPTKWSTEDVRKWIVWHAREFNEPQINVALFQMTGPDLCRLSLDDFRRRTHVAGSNLYSQLYVWKSVSACKVEEPIFPQSTEYDCIVLTSHEFPAPSVSPCPSNTSEDSNTSSSNLSYTHVTSSDDEYPYPRKNARANGITHEHKQQTIHLWQFLKDLLLHPETNNNCIKWINREAGIFKIEDSVRVAKLWGRRKNRPAMNYDKLSRSIRQYYKKQIIKKTEHSKRLVYQFCQPYL